jgi:long-chain acyl-CoA synthetase
MSQAPTLPPGTSETIPEVGPGRADTVRARAAREPAGGWPLGLPARTMRRVLWATLLGPFVDTVYDLRAHGTERLDALDGAVIFAANHCAHLDNAFIIVALPGRWRRRLAIAAATTDIFGPRHFGLPLKGWLAQLLGNAFAFTRKGRKPARVDHLQGLLDRGWSVLIFPEGKLTVCGPTQPFKAGIGLLAVETGVPVVPVRVDVVRRGFWEGAGLRRGAIDVHFGEPLRFEPDADPAVVKAQLEAAVRDA